MTIFEVPFSLQQLGDIQTYKVMHFIAQHGFILVYSALGFSLDIKGQLVKPHTFTVTYLCRDGLNIPPPPKKKGIGSLHI